MNSNFQNLIAANFGLLACSFSLSVVLAEPAGRMQSVESRSGSVKFVATTNISAISIHGQSNNLRSHVSLNRVNGQVVLEDLEARLDPKSLSTGMAIRDHHMREKIFNTAADTAPDLLFTSPKLTCPDAAKGQESTCQVSGSFSLRGVTKPFAMAMRIKADGTRYKVSGEGVLKITDFGIERPCQLGVCVSDEVKLKIDFQAEEQITNSKAEARPGDRR